MTIAALRLHTAFCLAALFTISWDRLANLAVGTYNVKLPVLLFACSLVASFLTPQTVPSRRPIGWSIAALLAAYMLGVLLADEAAPALGQLATVILGALVPFLAVERTLRLGEDAARLLSAFISGGVVAALFGLYQLTAERLGLPNPLPYEGLAQGLGRISSFTYEPAYCGYFLILVLAAYTARQVLTGQRHNRLGLVVLLAALLLCNSRAVVFTLPLLGILLFVRARHIHARRSLPVTGVLAGYLAVVAVIASGQLREFLTTRVGSIGDLAEQTSNAPRVETYGAVWRLVQDHWLVGVGPGNLITAGPWYGLRILPWPPPTPNNVIANNIWLQAASDGGVLLLAAHVLLVAVVVRRLYRSSEPVPRALVAGWLTIVLVGGMLTSYFYDVKLWAVLGLAAGLAAQNAVGRVPTSSERHTGDVSPPLKN